MKPPVPYFGGKQLLAERIIATFPEHEHYVEPFAGSLAVLLAKRPARREVVNDLDGDLMTFWRVLRDAPGDLIRACALTPHSRAELADSYAALPGGTSDLERARRVFVQLTQSRLGVRTKSGWRNQLDPATTQASLPIHLAGYVSRLAPAAERLMSVSLESRPALEVIADHGRFEQTLLYIDPPYLGSTRYSRYAVEMTADDQHRELAEALLGCRAAVVLSGYPSPLYDSLYGEWERIELDTTTGQGGTLASRTEVVWSNRKIGEPDLLDLLGEAS